MLAVILIFSIFVTFGVADIFAVVVNSNTSLSVILPSTIVSPSLYVLFVALIKSFLAVPINMLSSSVKIPVPLI